MANFSRRKIKPRRDDGTYIFSDFSNGLYLLDTPRGIGEQLASLAITGGRNIWSENGALIPQYGYMEDGKIENEYIIAVSKDTGDASFFLLTNIGNVYLYTVSQGLKLYATKIDEISENAILTCRQNQLLIVDNDNKTNILFGGYDEDDTMVTINEGIEAQNYNNYLEIKVPKEYEKYYWIGKNIGVSGLGKTTVTYMSKTAKGIGLGDIKWGTFNDSNSTQLRQTVQTVDKQDRKINLSASGSDYINIKTTKGEGTTQTITESVLDWVCYKINYPSGFKYNGFLFATSINKDLPKYIWLPKSAAAGSVNIKTTSTGSPISGMTSSSLINVTTSCTSMNPIDRRVYKNEISSNPFKAYTASNGFITSLCMNPNASLTVLGKTSTGFTKLGMVGDKGVDSITISRYSAGDVYKTTTKTIVVPATETTTQISCKLFLQDSSPLEYTSSKLTSGTMEWRITYTPETNTTVFGIYKGSDLIESSAPFVGKPTKARTAPNEIIGGTKANIGLYKLIDGEYVLSNTEEYDAVVIRVVTDSDTSKAPAYVSTYERARHDVTLTYTPEATSKPTVNLIPRLVAWANNRLFVVNNDGMIYYSQVGIIDSFQEKFGAGYFGGFYGDNSEVLSVEEFLTYTLITKKNGMYVLKLADTTSSDSVSINNSVGIQIEKIAEIGQQYASDHVIVRDKIYAYDSNACSIVNAIQQTIFGTLSSGQTIISAENLDAVRMGIPDSRRFLTYNGEADTMILYYGEDLSSGIVITTAGTIFPRELDSQFTHYVGLNQGVYGVTRDGRICQDFKKNSIILNITPVVTFEPIGLKDNRCICSSILEVTELNGIKYDITCQNAGVSYQSIHPHINYGVDKVELPPFVYSDKKHEILSDSYELTSKWAEKLSNLTRVYAPMSGRNGISITIEFAANQEFCLAALRLPDFSQGE